MATLQSMPPLQIDTQELAKFGEKWVENGQSLSRTPPYSSGNLGKVFDKALGNALAIMLGNIPIVKPNSNALIPSQPDCVEVGELRVIGYF